MTRRRSWMPEWRKMRENHLLTYPACAICEDAKKVHVHHLRYRGPRGKSEIPGDLVTLCVFHHADLHRSLKPAATSVQGTIDYIARARAEARNAEIALLLRA